MDLLWVFFCLVFSMPLCASVYMCLVHSLLPKDNLFKKTYLWPPAGKGLTS